MLRVGEPGGALGRLDLAHLGGGGLENAAKGPLHTWPTKANRQRISNKLLQISYHGSHSLFSEEVWESNNSISGGSQTSSLLIFSEDEMNKKVPIRGKPTSVSSQTSKPLIPSSG